MSPINEPRRRNQHLRTGNRPLKPRAPRDRGQQHRGRHHDPETSELHLRPGAEQDLVRTAHRGEQHSDQRYDANQRPVLGELEAPNSASSSAAERARARAAARICRGNSGRRLTGGLESLGHNATIRAVRRAESVTRSAYWPLVARARSLRRGYARRDLLGDVHHLHELHAAVHADLRVDAVRWSLTVCRLMNSSSAICLFVLPRQIFCTICRSRFVTP